MKNYFTDSQVKEAVKNTMPWSSKLQLSIPQLAEFKALMNLAVEAAIGEPVAYTDDNEGFISKNTNDFYCTHGLHKFCNRELYSVKELEN